MKKFAVQFCGATGEVTGSMHLVSFDKVQILLDAGAFQGSNAQEKNAARFLFNP